MCLEVSGDRVRYLIAKEDIVVYKRLRKGSNKSPYQSFVYKKNTEYTSHKRMRAVCGWSKRYWSIDEGLHAYVSKSTARYWSLHNAYSHAPEKIVRMIIPAGTRYVIGAKGDIVADKMVTKSLRAV